MGDSREKMKVFVSHAHEDDAFCRVVVEGLRGAGVDVWYDEHNLGSGLLIDTIEQELRARPVFVLILSPAALRSQWVRDETKWAYASFKRDPSRIILPVLAAPLSDEGDIWLFLQDFKRIELSGLQPHSPKRAARRLLHTLGLTPGGQEPAPASMPQPLESADDLIARARALGSSKDAEAVRLLRRATRVAPLSSDAWFELGGSLYRLNQFAEAVVAWERATSLDPTRFFAWAVMATTLNKLHRYDKALAASQQATSLDPSHAYPWHTMGLALNGLGRYDEALTALNQANYSHESADVWQAMAIALRGLGQSAEARSAERRAKELGG